jgi:hypothetical protein
MHWSDLAFVIVALAACAGCFVVLPVYIIARGLIDKHRAKAELKERVHDAIEKITADGKVEGPKGPYVRRKRHGPLTDGSTSPPTTPGYYHHPWQ